jgi:DNA-damage-inducible protein J
MIRARTEPDVKEKAEAVIREMGLNPSSVITMLYRAIIRRGALPFDPNITTLAAMRAAKRAENLIRAKSADDLIGLLADEKGTARGARGSRQEAVQKGPEANRKARVERRAPA